MMKIIFKFLKIAGLIVLGLAEIAILVSAFIYILK